MWVATVDLLRSAAHPFYMRLNQMSSPAPFKKQVTPSRPNCCREEANVPGAEKRWAAPRPLMIAIAVVLDHELR